MATIAKLEKIAVIRGTLKLLSGLHIGAGATEMHIGGTDNPVIKDCHGRPYVPGSSLKGKIRSLLEQYAGSEENPEVEMLFGVKKADDDKRKERRPARLAFWDCPLAEDWVKRMRDQSLPLTEVKMENSINRISGTAEHPRNTERVNAGAEFCFQLSFKVLADDPGRLRHIILGGLRLLEHDSLGGSGSRGYGKVAFQGLTFDGADIQAEFAAIQPFAANLWDASK